MGGRNKTDKDDKLLKPARWSAYSRYCSGLLPAEGGTAVLPEEPARETGRDVREDGGLQKK